MVLPVLQQLGLRTTASQDTLVEAARFVERLGGCNVKGRLEEQQQQLPAGADVDMAVARGKVCYCLSDAESAFMIQWVCLETHVARHADLSNLGHAWMEYQVME